MKKSQIKEEPIEQSEVPKIKFIVEQVDRNQNKVYPAPENPQIDVLQPITYLDHDPNKQLFLVSKASHQVPKQDEGSKRFDIKKDKFFMDKQKKTFETMKIDIKSKQKYELAVSENRAQVLF